MTENELVNLSYMITLLLWHSSLEGCSLAPENCFYSYNLEVIPITVVCGTTTAKIVLWRKVTLNITIVFQMRDQTSLKFFTSFLKFYRI